MEYVEVEDRQQEAFTQRRYLDENNSYQNQSYEPSFDDRRTYQGSNPYYEQKFSKSETPVSGSRPASRRPIQNTQELLDVEPVEFPKRQKISEIEKNIVNNEDVLEDPW